MPKKTPTTKQGKRAKVETVMREFAHGELASSSGQKVTTPAQAKAIAMRVSGQSKPKASRRPAFRQTKRPPDVVTVQRS